MSKQPHLNTSQPSVWRVIATTFGLAGAFAALLTLTPAFSTQIGGGEPLVAAIPSDGSEAVIERLLADNPTADEARATALPGIYELRFGFHLAYVDATGRYAFAGDLRDNRTGASLTEERRSELRRELMGRLDEIDTINFPPEGTPTLYQILVFTDVDCGYCREFHSRLPEYQAYGISVNYVAFPRSGPKGATWKTMRSIWCSDNPKAALNAVKNGVSIAEKVCEGDDPIEAHYKLAGQIGLRGTPLVVTPQGRIIQGYLPPDELLIRLEDENLAPEAEGSTPVG